MFRDYALECFKESLNRQEAPLLSHLLYPQVLNDDDAKERKLGIECGLNWLWSAELHVFYIDHGMSKGMMAAFTFNRTTANRPIEFRSRKFSLDQTVYLKLYDSLLNGTTSSH